jgi:hypothetical protein
MNSDQVLEVSEMKELVELDEFNERYTDALVIFEGFEGIICVLVGEDEGAPHYYVGQAEGVESGGLGTGPDSGWRNSYNKATLISNKDGDWDLQKEYFVYLRVYEKYGRQIVVPKAEDSYNGAPGRGRITPEIEAYRRRAAVLAVEARLRGESVALVPLKQSDLEITRQEISRLSCALQDLKDYAKVYEELHPASWPAEEEFLQTKIAELKTKLAQVEASFIGIEQARESRWAAFTQMVTNQ